MDLLKDGLLELINAVKTLAPLVWAIFMKQIYSHAIIQLVVGILFLAVTIFLVIVLAKNWEDLKNEDDAPVWLIAGVVVTFVIAVILFVNSFMGFYNPEYYAIQLLLEQIR